MATITWYGDGTATATTGSKVVTGTGTGWLSSVGGLTPIKVGDKFGLHVGQPIVIEQIISDTELRLADNWPGPDQTDAPYKVELTNPAIAAVEALRQLLAQLEVGLDDDQLPARIRATPVSVSAANALDAITETGWVSVSNASAATVNGPVSGVGGICFTYHYGAANAAQEYIAVAGITPRKWIRHRLAVGTVWQAWREMVVGDASGGVSNSFLPARLKESAVIIADLNDPNIPSGWHYAPASAINKPDNLDYYLFHIRSSSATYQIQFAYVAGGVNFGCFSRKLRANVWDPWQRVGQPTLGTVSQTGGVPYGAIIERGSNANGEYVRYADGTQICWNGSLAGLPTTTNGNVARSDVITATFPAPFVSAATLSGAASTANAAYWISGTFSSTTSCSMRLFSTAAAAAVNVSYLAIGRWF